MMCKSQKRQSFETERVLVYVSHLKEFIVLAHILHPCYPPQQLRSTMKYKS
jgi:hypothetical protein